MSVQKYLRKCRPERPSFCQGNWDEWVKKRRPSASLRNGSGSKRENKTKNYILSRNYRKAWVYERFLLIVLIFEVEDFNKQIQFCWLLFMYILLMLVTVSREPRVRERGYTCLMWRSLVGASQALSRPSPVTLECRHCSPRTSPQQNRCQKRTFRMKGGSITLQFYTWPKIHWGIRKPKERKSYEIKSSKIYPPQALVEEL